jgi:hypothetical protein
MRASVAMYLALFTLVMYLQVLSNAVLQRGVEDEEKLRMRALLDRVNWIQPTPRLVQAQVADDERLGKRTATHHIGQCARGCTARNDEMRQWKVQQALNRREVERQQRQAETEAETASTAKYTMRYEEAALYEVRR